MPLRLPGRGELRNTFSTVWQFASATLGLCVFALLMWWIVKSHSHMWRLVRAAYPKRTSVPVGGEILDTVVIASRGMSGPTLKADLNYRQYAGALIAVTDRAICLALVPPFNISCSPIELPFDEMELHPTDWALWSDPKAIRMRALKDIDIILGQDTIRWLRQQTTQGPFGREF